MPKILNWIALIAYCGLIYWLSSKEHIPLPDVFNFQDKVLHAGAYFMMAVLSWRAFSHFQMPLKTLAWSSVIFCSIYGISDEWHQSFVSGRSSSAADWVADTIGAAVAVILLSRVRRLISGGTA